MFCPTHLFASNLVPAKPRRAVSTSLGTISFILIAIALAVLAKQASAAGPQCAAPYVQVTGQGSPPNGGDMTGELQIQSISIGEPFDGICGEKSLTVVIKVKSLDPGGSGMVTPLYNSEWEAEFIVPSTVTSDGLPHTVFVSWDTQTVPTGTFNYGFLDTSSTPNFYYSQCGVTGTCPATGTVTVDGTITVKLNLSSPISFANNTATVFTMGAIPPGTFLTSIAGHIWTCACAAGNGLLVTQSTATGSQNYTVQGNISCSAAPVAALSAMPTTGNAPLTVNFDASGSNIPSGGCGSINSYLFDFGDASGATQSTPTVSHTYNTGGATYPARVRVTSTVGLTSSNIAEQDITVNTAGPPVLVSVGSRATHGSVGDFDVNLNLPPNSPTNPRGVECRNTGGNYKVVFTFLNNLIGVGSPSVTTGTFGTVSGVVGPNANQYTVNLTGVANVQYVGITLLAAHDITGALGNEPEVQMGVLLGDVTANGVVTNTDVGAVKGQVSPTTPITLANFRDDVTVNGFVTNTDVGLVKGQVNPTGGLPSPP